MSDLVNVGGLWLNEKNGKSWMSGYLGKASILIFKNTHKEQGSNAPDYTLHIGKGKDQREWEEKKSGEGGEDTGNVPF